MRKIIEYILLGIVAGVIIVYVYTFFPTVEEIKYSDQKDDRFKGSSKNWLKSVTHHGAQLI